jgi:ADP-heptose:LPS heptosyltransferase
MTVPTEINQFRRTIMHRLTRSVGHASQAHLDPSEKSKIKRILISRPNNRLGNLLLITPLLQEIERDFPNAKIDLFVRGGLAKILFSRYENVSRIMALPAKPFDHLLQYLCAWKDIRRQTYDLVINVDNESSSGRLSTQFAKSRHKIFGDVPILANDARHIAKRPVYELREYLNSKGYSENKEEIPMLDLKLSASELLEGQTKLQDLVANDHPTIAIFTYATGAKLHPVSWWMPFYEKLRQAFPDFNIIEVLPKENVSQINFTAPWFYSNDVREIAALIANTEVFIAADSGMMHLGSASKTPTIGLFHASDPSKYEPYGNDSFSIDTNANDLEACMQIIRDAARKKCRALCEFS